MHRNYDTFGPSSNYFPLDRSRYRESRHTSVDVISKQSLSFPVSDEK